MSGKIYAKSRVKKQSLAGVSIPKLRGHTKITLRDAKTGEITDVSEQDNLVTNALSDLFANNIYGSMNYADLTPLRTMLGGIMCFEDEITAQASNYLPPNQADNKLIAHAGQTSHSSASTKRGNPNGVLSEVIQNGKGYKFVWDFPSSVGNGTISCCCLTSALGGDAGLTPIELIANSPLMAFSSTKSKAIKTGVSKDFSTYYNCVVKVDLTNSTGLHVYMPDRSGSSLIVNEVEISLKKQGINDDLADARLTATHTITLTRSFDRRYTGICCDDNYMYVVEPSANEGATLYVNKINLSTWAVTSADITDASLSLRKTEFFRNEDFGYSCRTVVSDGYLYWFKSDKRTMYKFDLSTPANIVEVETALEEDANEEYGMVELAEGIVVGKNFFVNDKVYPMATESASKVVYYTDYTTPFIRILRDGNLFFIWSYLYNTSYSTTDYASCSFPRVMLHTIQNLASPVVKTSDKTMQIEYSVTLSET